MRTAALVVGLLLLSASDQASAFCRAKTCRPDKESCEFDSAQCMTTGVPLIWTRPMPLLFRFHERGSSHLVNEEARAAVRAAFFRWTDVICPGGRTALRFQEGEDLTPDKPLGDAPRPSPFGIYFRDLGWPYKSEGGDGQLALTTIDFAAQSGRIVYADIEINTTDQAFTTSEGASGTDLQTVVTHEVGHYFGLAHSLVPNSIMAAGLCETRERCSGDTVAARRLGDDDRAGVCALYPPAGAGAPVGEPTAPPPESGGCVVGPSGSRSSSDLVTTIAGVIACGWLARRRRRARSRSHDEVRDASAHAEGPGRHVHCGSYRA